MKIAFHTLGCKLNFAETSDLGRRLLQNGHQRVGEGEQADVCILNTCSVTDAADHKGRQAIRSLHRQYPGAVIIVTGCYAQLKPEEVAHIEGVSYVVGQNEKHDIDRLVDMLGSADTANLPRIISSPLQQSTLFVPSFSKDDRTRCFLKIQDGCDYYCTYCTIPFARGRSRNASIADTVNLATQALDQGHKEIVLTGVNIGDFGKSTDEHFIDLLDALDHLPYDFRMRISSCEPNLLSDQIIALVAQSRHIAPHFHIPLQSGTDQMLRLMHRRYNTDLFAERVDTIRRLMPRAFIGVDCMVGVRGESHELFQQYYHFVEQMPVSQLHVFTYSERQGTQMLRMNLEVVPAAERKRRSELMHRLSDSKLRAFYDAHKGTTATVLWEGKCQTTADQQHLRIILPDNPQPTDSTELMAGFTDNYIKVYRPYDPARVNTFETVTI